MRIAFRVRRAIARAALAVFVSTGGAGAAYAAAPAATAPAEAARAAASAAGVPGAAAATTREPPLVALRTCLDREATAEERRAGFDVGFDVLLRAWPQTQPFAPTADWRAARTAALARGVERLAAGPCREPLRELRANRPEGVVAQLASELYAITAPAPRDPPPDWQALRAATSADLLRQVKPEALDGLVADAEATVSQPPPPAPPPGVRPARIAPGIDLATLCTYPPAARRMQESGRAVLLLKIDAEGFVQAVEFEERTGYRRLDDYTAACLSGAVFEPLIVDGVPIASVQRLRWNWKLED